MHITVKVQNKCTWGVGVITSKTVHTPFKNKTGKIRNKPAAYFTKLCISQVSEFYLWLHDLNSIVLHWLTTLNTSPLFSSFDIFLELYILFSWLSQFLSNDSTFIGGRGLDNHNVRHNLMNNKYIHINTPYYMCCKIEVEISKYYFCMIGIIKLYMGERIFFL